jgi:hypothetical protein
MKLSPKKNILPLIYLMTSFYGFTQDYNFHKPLSIPISIGAYFGDLRPNHFHMGIDYRTNGVEGLNLHSISDGYVSRVRTTPYGYGKVVYINHTNGLTSVYAHCSKFLGKLDSVVNVAKLNQQNNEIELYLDSNAVPLYRGEVFALSGNTGSSTGPHLHFEIRETATDTPLNPLLYGLGNKDIYKPTINTIKVYGLSNEGFIIPKKSKTFNVTNGRLATGNTIVLPANYTMVYGTIGIGISGHDSHSTGACGLYENKITSNKDLLYHTKLNRVSFEETRYINTYKDYSGYISGLKIHKLFKNTTNQFNSTKINSTGRLKLYPCDSIPIEIETIDAFSNSYKIKFGLSIASGEMDTTQYYFPETTYWIPNKKYEIQLSNCSLLIDTLSLYEPTKMNIVDKGQNISFGDINQAIHKPIIISYNKWKRSTHSDKNYFIGYLNGSRYDYCETYVDNNLLKTKALKFGTYNLILDTIKPKITPLNYTNLGFSSKSKTLVWTIADNESKLFKYDVYINNEWIAADFDYKTKKLKSTIEKPLQEIYCIRIIVSDVCSNENILETSFH